MRMWRRNSFRKILAAALLTDCSLLPAGFGQDFSALQVNDWGTIMAWFDRWLKGQPEWWFDLYANK